MMVSKSVLFSILTLALAHASVSRAEDCAKQYGSAVEMIKSTLSLDDASVKGWWESQFPDFQYNFKLRPVKSATLRVLIKNSSSRQTDNEASHVSAVVCKTANPGELKVSLENGSYELTIKRDPKPKVPTKPGVLVTFNGKTGPYALGN